MPHSFPDPQLWSQQDSIKHRDLRGAVAQPAPAHSSVAGRQSSGTEWGMKTHQHLSQRAGPTFQEGPPEDNFKWQTLPRYFSAPRICSVSSGCLRKGLCTGQDTQKLFKINKKTHKKVIILLRTRVLNYQKEKNQRQFSK